MKTIQAGILKSVGLATALFVVCFSLAAQPNAYLEKADNLFKKKQYTQSFELYDQLLKQHKYTPAMLLRMAFIQEGLGHVSQTLYYLDLYYNVSHDERVLAKIEELATNNKLEGYNLTSPTARILTFLENNYEIVAGTLVSAIILLFAIAWKTRRAKAALVPISIAGLLIIGLLVHINFTAAPETGIINNPSTYLMSGPSAGAPVVLIVGEGHRLEIIGRNDVWVKVRWGAKEVWLKESALLPVRI